MAVTGVHWLGLNVESRVVSLRFRGGEYDFLRHTRVAVNSGQCLRRVLLNTEQSRFLHDSAIRWQGKMLSYRMQAANAGIKYQAANAGR